MLRRRISSRGWGSYVHVKEGVIDRLRHDLRRLPKGTIGVSTVTDPYQPIEKRFALTRQALEAMGEARFRVSIQTKSSLVTRDLDVIRSNGFELGMTITSLDDAFRKRFEPGASPPEERTMALEEASSMGIKTWVFYGPIIPGINDSATEISAIARLAERSGSMVLYDRLNLKPLMRSRIQGALTEQGLQVVSEADFAAIFGRLSSACRERGVTAKYAF